jgi:hypothetical protein
MTIFQIFSVKRPFDKFVFGQMTFFGKMDFRSNGVRLNGDSVEWTFGQMAYGQAVFGQMVFSVKWSRTENEKSVVRHLPQHQLTKTPHRHLIESIWERKRSVHRKKLKKGLKPETCQILLVKWAFDILSKECINFRANDLLVKWSFGQMALGLKDLCQMTFRKRVYLRSIFSAKWTRTRK